MFDDPRQEMEHLNAQLDETLRLFGDFEATIGQRMKLASDRQQAAALFAELAAYESCLGVDVLVDRIEFLRQRLLQRP